MVAGEYLLGEQYVWDAGQFADRMVAEARRMWAAPGWRVEQRSGGVVVESAPLVDLHLARWLPARGGDRPRPGDPDPGQAQVARALNTMALRCDPATDATTRLPCLN